MNLLGQRGSGPADLPRIGADYFFADHWSIGASVLFIYAASVGLSGRANVFMAAPRAGYAMMFNDVIGIWPRAGISYFLEDPGEGSLHYFSFDAELPFIFNLIPAVAISVGPTFDISFEGKESEEFMQGGPYLSSGTSYTAYGIQAGAMLLL